MKNAHKKYIKTQTTLSGTSEGDGNGIELVSLDGLGVDHEAIGENMARSVAAWLDEEVRTLLPQVFFTLLELTTLNFCFR